MLFVFYLYIWAYLIFIRSVIPFCPESQHASCFCNFATSYFSETRMQGWKGERRHLSPEFWAKNRENHSVSVLFVWLLTFLTLTSLFKHMMRSGSQVCLGRGLYIYTKTPEFPQYNGTMAETATQHLHVFGGVRMRAHVCRLTCVWPLLILCHTN